LVTVKHVTRIQGAEGDFAIFLAHKSRQQVTCPAARSELLHKSLRKTLSVPRGFRFHLKNRLTENPHSRRATICCVNKSVFAVGNKGEGRSYQLPVQMHAICTDSGSKFVFII